MPRSAFLRFTALACLILPLALRAQDAPARTPAVQTLSPRVTGNTFIQSWRPEDYGGGLGSTALLQHPITGFIYAGNSQGVLEFDGARWQLIPVPHSGAVLALAVDVHGRVWAATENEIARIEPGARGPLEATTVLYPLPDGERSVIDQALAADDGVWFRGLQHILRVGFDGRVTTWRTGERFGLMWSMAGAVHTTISEREVVRAEADGKLAPLLSLSSLKLPPNRPSPFRVFASRRDANGDWIVLTPIGPARFRETPRSWRQIPMRPALFRDAEAVAATFLNDGAMVFVTTRPGGVIVAPDGRVGRVLDRMPAVINSRVTHLMADREDGLWVSSRDAIARLQLRSAFARHEGSQGLQGNPRQVLRHGEALFVAHSGGVSRFVDWPGVFPPADGLHRGAEALVVVEDRLYAAASSLVEVVDRGLMIQPLSNLAITSLSGVRGRPDTLLGGDPEGLWWFRREGEAWKAQGRLHGLETTVGAIFDCGDGWVWGATQHGRVWRADFREGMRLDAPLTIYGPEHGVPPVDGSARLAFFALGESTVVTSPGGMARYEPALDRFVPETRIAGIDLPAHLGAEAVGPNADGSCWVRMGPPDRRILRIVADGPERWRTEELPGSMIRDLAAASLFQDGQTLWVAGKDLLVSIDLQWKVAEKIPPQPPRLRSLTTDDRRVLWRDAEGLPTEPLALEDGQVSLRFGFTAPTFVTDHRGRPCVRYRSQLAGLERGWSAWSAEAWRDYTEVPPGHYAFRLQAMDHLGRVTEAPALAVTITPPWWLTHWAWAGYVALGGAGLMGLTTLRTRALRRRAAELEAKIAARTEELRRSNAELARLHRLELDEKGAARRAAEQARLEMLRYQLNPHFLYNALNSIYGLVLTTPPAAANMVLRLADFCRVALDRRYEEHTTVATEFDKLANYLEIEKARWGDSLHVSVEADDEARRADLPPFLLLPLIENAIKYGGQTSPEELHVRVTARVEPDGALVIVVANTGAWVQRSAHAPGSSGIGLGNLRQRLQRYHPEAHEISIATADGWVVVTLRILPGAARPAGTAAAAAER